VWQKIYDDFRDRNFVVIAVAMDNDIEAARPWIEEAKPAYPVLIDRFHQLADLYNMVNVPQAVWIDEQGTIVRPTENAGAFEGFRALDFETMTVPDEVAATVRNSKSTYAAAVRDWATKGADSAHAFSPEEARAHVKAPDGNAAEAHVLFRLGLYLQQVGKTEEGTDLLARASELHPHSWSIWRQAADKLDNGLAAGPAFWQRVQALGENHYYQPVDMEGMPTEGPPKV
jgi:hypothetical protein